MGAATQVTEAHPDVGTEWPAEVSARMILDACDQLALMARRHLEDDPVGTTLTERIQLTDAAVVITSVAREFR